MTRKYDLLSWILIGSSSSLLVGQQASAPAEVTSVPVPRALVDAKSLELSDVLGGLGVENGSLRDIIGILARQLKINYVLDPRVHGGLTLYSYGETKALDPRSLLEAILRINGYAMVQEGGFYRIVPVDDVMRLPILPEQNASPNDKPDEDKIILNFIFVKYLSADELLKVLSPFLGENAKAFTYPPANMMLILDSRRNMGRLLDLISRFDDAKFEHERVRLFSLTNARPSDLAKELESVVKTVFATANFAPIVLLPIDRIGAIVAVAKSPLMFPQLEEWITKLDVPVTQAADAVANHVYKVKFGDAKELASSIMALYGGGGSQAGLPPTPSGTTLNNQVNGAGSFGLVSPMRADLGPGSLVGSGSSAVSPRSLPFAPPFSGSPVPSSTSIPNDLTGMYVGDGDSRGQRGSSLRVVARASNYLMIQATRTDYENVISLLKDLDVPPRQVLIEAKIYEVDLTYSFSSSVSGSLQELAANSVHQFLGNLSGSVTNLTIGGLIGRSRELLGAVQLEETQNRAKVISAPSIIATDGIPASMNVGTTVPTLAAQAVTGAQQNGSSLFANTIINQDSGITLSVLARVTASGIVTMDIGQQVSAPIPPSSTGIQSPSFSNRTIQTRVTLQDGDTIAIGGIIDQQNTYTTSGIPFLNRLPVIGWAFGSRAYNKEKTELIIFITPKVIYDNNGIAEASGELKERLKDLSRFGK